jgi:hypothetical protein
MRPIILFRFHDSLPVCHERLKLLNALNPGVPIYGLYGGPPEDLSAARSALADLVGDIQPTEHHDAHWHWLHVDLDVKHWYRRFGHSVDFDVLFDHEWDILTTDSLTSIYPPVDTNTIAVCSLTPLTREVEDAWEWTGAAAHRPIYMRFIQYMRETFGMGPQQYVSHGPGIVLPRQFLERFVDVEDIDLVISEIAYPAYAQAFGFQIINNNFRQAGVIDLSEEDFFNAQDQVVTYEHLVTEFVKPHGRRAFHPVKYSFGPREFRAIQRLSRNRVPYRWLHAAWRKLLPPPSYIRYCYPPAAESWPALTRSYVWRARKLLRRDLGAAIAKSRFRQS